MLLRSSVTEGLKVASSLGAYIEKSAMVIVLAIKTWLDRTPASQLATTSLILLVPTVLFWLSIFLYLTTHNSILLDLFFNNHFVGYFIIAVLPIAAGLLAFLSFRKKHTAASRLGLTISIVFLLFFLVALLRPS